MKTKIVEATNNLNWGKFLIGAFDTEWSVRSAVDVDRPLLRTIGMHPRQLLVLDLQTCEGACFCLGGHAGADLAKHKIWVCPMFEPFLEWLYAQDVSDLDALPAVVHLDAPFELRGYRRQGPR